MSPRSIVCSAVFLFSFLIVTGGVSFAAFEPLSGIHDAKIENVAISPVHSQIVGVVSQDRFYMSTDGGNSFQLITSFYGTINHLEFDQKWPEVAYISTDRGLIQVRDRTQNIIYRSDGPESVLTMAQHRGKTYLGTTQGLYVSPTGDWVWEKIGGAASNVVVLDIEPSHDQLLFVANDGVYELNIASNKTNKLYSISGAQSRGEIEESLDEGEDFVERALREGFEIPFSLQVNIFDRETIFLGTSEGLFYSANSGSSWDRFSTRGMGNAAVFSIAQSPGEESSLYAATAQGLYHVDIGSASATQLYQGLTASDIAWVTLSPDGIVYVATDNGAFTSSSRSLSLNAGIGDDITLKLGPDVKRVHQAALEYNKLDPDRVGDWYERVNKQAWYPELSFDVDGVEGEFYQGSTATPSSDRFLEHPDDYDWSISLDWDFSELIWSSDMRQIGATSRLIHRERTDLLEEVNRIYYERRRLVREHNQEEIEPARKYELQSRIQELTSILDAYTGGEFSRQLRQIHN